MSSARHSRCAPHSARSRETAAATVRSALFTLLLATVAVPADAQQRVELPARDNALRSRPVDVWSVGTDEGESWEMLSNVMSMAFDANDNLHALDQGNHRILVFDRNGQFVRQFGKQGEGPGEFQAPMAIAILGDGTVVVTDLGRRGFVLFDARGTYLRDVPLPDDFGLPRPNELYVRGNEIIARSMPLLRFSPGSQPDLTSPRKSPVFRFDFTGDPPRTLHEFLMDPPQVRTSSSGGRRTVMAMMSRATFEKEPTFAAVADGGVAISAANDYSIEIKDASGRVVRSLARPVNAKRVTDRDRDDAREQARERMKNGSGTTMTMAVGGGGATFRSGVGGGAPMTDDQIEQNIAQMTFAEEIPAIERIWSDATGRLWIVRRPERVGRDKPVDLVAAGDRYVGTVTGIAVPSAVSSSGLAAWVEKDEFDIEKIVVRRLPADWR